MKLFQPIIAAHHFEHGFVNTHVEIDGVFVGVWGIEEVYPGFIPDAAKFTPISIGLLEHKEII